MKKFFKAMLIGILEIMSGLGGTLAFGLIYLGPIGFIATILGTLLRYFDISDGEAFMIGLVAAPCALLLGTSISSKIMHALMAVKYAKKNKCDIHKAWKETELVGGSGEDW